MSVVASDVIEVLVWGCKVLILVKVMVALKKNKKNFVKPLYCCCLYSPPDYTNHCLNKSLPNVNQASPVSHPPS